MNKAPNYLKWIKNESAITEHGTMISSINFVKDKVFNTKDDFSKLFNVLASSWDELYTSYSFNFEECLPEKYYVSCNNNEQSNDVVSSFMEEPKNYTYWRYISNFHDSHPTEKCDIHQTVSPNSIVYSYDEWKRLYKFKEQNGYIAFKGFDKELKCRGEKFEIGITYSKSNLGRKPTLCSTDGYHYCDKLKNINPHYDLKLAYENKFCLIEILDEYTKDSDKGITYSFRIIRELTREEITNILHGYKNNESNLIQNELDNYEEKKKIRDENELKLREKLNIQVQIDLAVKEKLNQLKQEKQDKIKSNTDKMVKSMKLDLIKKFQEQYPHTQIGGSVGLFLHGIRLDRFKQTINDFDIITPYYTKFEDFTDIVIYDNVSDEGRSGNDFTECITINGVKADVRIDNTQKYDIIEFERFKYKVSVLEAIWAAKLRYNNKKHINDLKEAMNIGVKI